MKKCSSKTTRINFLKICMEVWLLHCRWYSSFCGSCSSGKLELQVWVKSPKPLGKQLKLVRGQPEIRLCRLSVFYQVFCDQDVICILGWAVDMETSRFSYILSHLTPNQVSQGFLQSFYSFCLPLGMGKELQNQKHWELQLRLEAGF